MLPVHVPFCICSHVLAQFFLLRGPHIGVCTYARVRVHDPPNIFDASTHSCRMRQSESEPTWRKYIVMCRVVENLRVRDKRHLFHIMRTHQGIDENSFLPAYGFTAGEFSVYQVLTESSRKGREPTLPWISEISGDQIQIPSAASRSRTLLRRNPR